MPEEYVDPSGNTQQFKAFVARQETAAEAPPPPAPSRLPLIVGLAVAAVVVVALLVWLIV